MPLYDFINNETQEVFTQKMSVAEMEEFLKNNPHIQIHWSGQAPALGDAIRLGLRKPDSSFRDVLKHVKKSHVRSTVNDW